MVCNQPGLASKEGATSQWPRAPLKQFEVATISCGIWSRFEWTLRLKKNIFIIFVVWGIGRSVQCFAHILQRWSWWAYSSLQRSRTAELWLEVSQVSSLSKLKFHTQGVHWRSSAIWLVWCYRHRPDGLWAQVTLPLLTLTRLTEWTCLRFRCIQSWLCTVQALHLPRAFPYDLLPFWMPNARGIAEPFVALILPRPKRDDDVYTHWVWWINATQPTTYGEHMGNTGGPSWSGSKTFQDSLILFDSMVIMVIIQAGMEQITPEAALTGRKEGLWFPVSILPSSFPKLRNLHFPSWLFLIVVVVCVVVPVLVLALVLRPSFSFFSL